jgi:hypothetical protein
MIKDHNIVQDVCTRVSGEGINGYPWQSLNYGRGTIVIYSKEVWEVVPTWAYADVNVSLPERQRVKIDDLELALPDWLRARYASAGIIRFEQRVKKEGPATKIRSRISTSIVAEVNPKYTSPFGWGIADAQLGITTNYSAAQWEPVTEEEWAPAEVTVCRVEERQHPLSAHWNRSCTVTVENRLIPSRFFIPLPLEMRASLISKGEVFFEHQVPA